MSWRSCAISPVMMILLVSCLVVGETSAVRAESQSPIDEAETAYRQHCAGCHGVDGTGNGVAAEFLMPRPRDFRTGKFQFRSVPPEQLPTDEDVYRVITRGIPGTAMVGWDILPEETRRALARYVKSFATQGDDGLSQDQTADDSDTESAAKAATPEPPGPLMTEERMATGRQVYDGTECWKCHGRDGRGDGPSVDQLSDAKGRSLHLLDFNFGIFEGGAAPRRLFNRITYGMPGAAMPAFGDTLTNDERWALVAYIKSLGGELQRPEPSSSLVVREVDQIPETIDQWDTREDIRSVRYLHPLWKRSRWPSHVEVRARTDRKHLAMLVHWSDRTKDQPSTRTDQFADALATMVSMTEDAPPFIGMGAAGPRQASADQTQRPSSPQLVDIWQWRAKGDLEGAGEPEDNRDEYHWGDSKMAYPAKQTDNPLASSTEDADRAHRYVASGPGTLTARRDAGAKVHTEARYQDGAWQVLLVAPLDASSTSGAKSLPSYVAFGVWDGAAKDRNGQKLITQWMNVEVK